MAETLCGLGRFGRLARGPEGGTLKYFLKYPASLQNDQISPRPLRHVELLAIFFADTDGVAAFRNAVTVLTARKTI
jgi:hypothetical protein